MAAKYGRGLNREVVAAVNQGPISEPFSLKDVRTFAEKERIRHSQFAITILASPQRLI
jgi:hypothetical protein